MNAENYTYESLSLNLFRVAGYGCIFLILVGIVSVVLMIHTNNVTQELEAVQQYGPVAAGCQAIQVGEALPTGTWPADGTHRRVGLIDVSPFEDVEPEVHEWQWSLPLGWQAWTPDDVGLIVCTQGDREVLNSCTYGGGLRLFQSQHFLHVWVIDAASGLLVDETTLEGPMPAVHGCPSSITVGSGGSSGLPDGDAIRLDQLTDYLQPFVDGA